MPIILTLAMQVAFVPGTHYVFTAGKDRALKYWDADRWELLLTLEGHHAEVRPPAGGQGPPAHDWCLKHLGKCLRHAVVFMLPPQTQWRPENDLALARFMLHVGAVGMLWVGSGGDAACITSQGPCCGHALL